MKRYGCVSLWEEILWGRSNQRGASHDESETGNLRGLTVAAAIALLPLATATAGGHGFRPHTFGLGRGIVGAAVTLATLPLAIASAVVSGGESVAPARGYGRPSYGYGPGYHAAPRAAYEPRPYYAPRAGYRGHGYYRAGGNRYPQR